MKPTQFLLAILTFATISCNRNSGPVITWTEFSFIGSPTHGLGRANLEGITSDSIKVFVDFVVTMVGSTPKNPLETSTAEIIRRAIIRDMRDLKPKEADKSADAIRILYRRNYHVDNERMEVSAWSPPAMDLREELERKAQKVVAELLKTAK